MENRPVERKDWFFFFVLFFSCCGDGMVKWEKVLVSVFLVEIRK